MTLLVSHGRHRLLLTGDLEGAGLAMLLKQAPRPVDVLMAPHHGSRLVEGASRLMEWARPRVVVSCQRGPRTPSRLPNPYKAPGVRFLGTWPEGAVTIRSHASGLVIETFVTKERFVVRSSR
jgi:competence protein ComEC